MSEKQRILWLDISKAFGILVVLLVHTGASLGPVTFYGGMFYMPVFFVIAGMTFSYKPEETFGGFLRKKAKRLLLPYFGYNLFLFAFFFFKDSLLGGQLTKASFFPLLGILYSRNSLFPMDSAANVYFMQILNAPTWFLTAMFVSYALLWLLMRASGGDLRKAAFGNILYLLAAGVLHYFCPVLLPWSMDGALYAVSFLLLGMWARQREIVDKLLKNPLLLCITAAVFWGLSRINGSVNMSVGDYGRSMALYLIVGFTGSLLAAAVSCALERSKAAAFLARPLAFLGRHTMPVLCLHLFVYSAAGMVLGFLGR